MVSPLFNLPGRLVLGSYCYYEHLPELLQLLARRATPEDIGQRMKRLWCRPNYISLNSLALGYLNGREQRRLRGQPLADDLQSVNQVLDFYARVAVSYRNDGCWLPDQADFSTPILREETLRQLVGQLHQPSAMPPRQQARRMLATLELFTFILNGEARVGVFHHGPYPLDGGDILVVKEFVGLQEDYYPWAKLERRLPYPALARVMRLRGIRARMDLFGSMTTEPKSYEDGLVAEALLTLDGNEFRPLSPPEVSQLSETAADAQLELYRRVMTWDGRYRISYGAELYGCLLRQFAELLGLAHEFDREIRQRFQRSIDQHLEELYTGAEPPVVLRHLAETRGEIYAPLCPADRKPC